MYGIPAVMAAVTVKVRRIAIVESTFVISGLNDVQGISALYLHVLQPDRIVLGKIDALVNDLPGSGTPHLIIPPATIYHRGERLAGQDPHRPCSLKVIK